MRSWPALVISFPPPPAGGTPIPSLQDLVSADFDGLDIVAIVEQPDGAWQVSFRGDAERAAAAAILRAAHPDDGLGVTDVDVGDEDWACRSQASLRTVRAGRIAVAPPWDAGAMAADPAVMTVVIEPAMGFGSGHHATTRLCLEALQRLELQGRRVLDVGTGSGVLALAAARLGAGSVLGIDVDPDALDNARGNAELNGWPQGIEFRQADFRQEAGLEADVVVANLTGGMLEAGAVDLARAVASGGALILSGITTDERDAVYRAFERGFRMDWSAQEDGWCCALLFRDSGRQSVARRQ